MVQNRKKLIAAIRHEFVVCLADEMNYINRDSLTPDWDYIFVEVFQAIAKRGFDINSYEKDIIEEYDRLIRVFESFST